MAEVHEDLAHDDGVGELCDEAAWTALVKGQVRTSRAKTRRRSSAQVERWEWERAELLGAVGELGASGPQEGEVDAGGIA